LRKCTKATSEKIAVYQVIEKNGKAEWDQTDELYNAIVMV
jgi:hypothetical protein